VHTKLWSGYLKKREHLADQSIEATVIVTVIYDCDIQEFIAIVRDKGPIYTASELLAFILRR
jgi:hypothetical protein